MKLKRPFSILTPLLLGWGMCAYASESNEQPCDKLLTVPKQFRDAFAMYTDQRFIQAVHKFKVSAKLFRDDHAIHEIEIDTAGPSDEYIDETKASAEVEYWPAEKLIHVGDLQVSDQFSEEYALKLMFAHYFNRFPGIERVGSSLFNNLPVSYSVLREALARGVPLSDALSTTPIGSAMRALGFAVDLEKVKFQSDPGPDEYTPSAYELWLEFYRPSASTQPKSADF